MSAATASLRQSSKFKRDENRFSKLGKVLLLNNDPKLKEYHCLIKG
jgi:hypothetical protein